MTSLRGTARLVPGSRDHLGHTIKDEKKKHVAFFSLLSFLPSKQAPPACIYLLYRDGHLFPCSFCFSPYPSPAQTACIPLSLILFSVRQPLSCQGLVDGACCHARPFLLYMVSPLSLYEFRYQGVLLLIVARFTFSVLDLVQRCFTSPFRFLCFRNAQVGRRFCCVSAGLNRLGTTNCDLGAASMRKQQLEMPKRSRR